MPVLVSKMAQKPDQLMKFMADMNQTMAGLLRSFDTLNESVVKGFEHMRREREEQHRSLTARVTSMGDKVSYLSENVCACMATTVSVNVHLEVHVTLR